MPVCGHENASADEADVQCKGCKNTMTSMALKTCSEERTYNFLCEHGIMEKQVYCENCNSPCTKTADGLFWRCQRVRRQPKRKLSVRCNFKRSVRAKTWFGHCSMSLCKVLRFITAFLILSTSRQKIVMLESEVSSHTFVKWSQFCREVMLFWASKNSTKLGGPNEIVEIDESKLGRRKYNVGRLIDGQWILGGVQRSSKKAFYVAVEKRDAETLLKVIQEWVEPGTTIITDRWKAYGKLNELGYRHLTVNHKENFVDPVTGAHTSHIERSWRDLKDTVPKYGKRKAKYAYYLAEVQFRRAFPQEEYRVHQFLKILADLSIQAAAVQNIIKDL